MAKILYFAWVREKMGRGEETLSLPDHITSVGDMLRHLDSLGEPYRSALADPRLRIAVNQVHCRPEEPVGNGDEIAIFPPVSGGQG
ncbi:MAG: molybdopterin converting factor subunit 1 [Magnetococcales bacterium]|nr:molybdopterin converting factor subunit 1 [Magnetococcales bacterium]